MRGKGRCAWGDTRPWLGPEVVGDTREPLRVDSPLDGAWEVVLSPV